MSLLCKNKITFGVLKGNAAVIHRGQVHPDKLIIAEGPETAASLIEPLDAIKKKRPVLASLSLSNVRNLRDLIANFWKPQEVIIAADNDGDNEAATKSSSVNFDIMIEELAVKHDIKCTVKKPLISKHDWNDVLKASGSGCIKKQFDI